ncbi:MULTISPECIES: maleylpyruvate isomerase family mycothiol-dependent enzyme [Streptomyces]|uniref:maleylpyruvate isomerase family mycothiol-dependent enzyme n=1 Tax=Streptomyces TaxID=1883 RepID=UPI00058E1784|nr:maleylpyruvate isomerase family mycothiol-dependent enzyme [Streptomyces sp. SCSIO ZS0520]AYN33951.1 maleylpyruvate isomerase family mycothiol-dependent enzyme [Streptomyces albus]
MSLHPSLQPYADAWTHAAEAISQLVTPLPDQEWNRATPCPGWSVRDVVSHVIGMECEALGDPRPIHTLPRDLYHVKTEPQRYMEVQVDVRRHHTAPEMTAELEYTIIRRSRQLRNEYREPDTEIRGLLGRNQTLEDHLRGRVFDTWVHAQDLRAALATPGDLDSPGSAVVRDTILDELPKIVAKRAGAAPGSAVVFDVGGPVEFLRTVRVDANGRGTIDGSPSLGPTLTLSLDWETFYRLACGRVTPESAAGEIKAEGDQELADAVLREIVVTF